ncbi:hypothetical protein NBRC10513v2_005237 [Rhodotorula toruloides]
MSHSPLPEGQKEGMKVGGLACDEEPKKAPIGLLSLPDELIARILDLYFLIDLSRWVFPDRNKLSDWDLTVVNRRIYDIGKSVLRRHIAVAYPGYGPSLPDAFIFLTAQSEPMRSTSSLYIYLDSEILPALAVMAPRVFPNLKSLAIVDRCDSEDPDDRELPAYLSDCLASFHQLQDLQLSGFRTIADDSFDVRHLRSLRTLRLSGCCMSILSPRLLRDGVGELLEQMEISATEEEPIPPLPLRAFKLDVPFCNVSLNSIRLDHPDVASFVDFLRAALAASKLVKLELRDLPAWPARSVLFKHTALRSLEVRLRDPYGPAVPAANRPQRERLPLVDLHYLIRQFPELSHFRLIPDFMDKCEDGQWLLRYRPTQLPAFAIFEPSLSALVQFLQTTKVLSFSFRPIDKLAMMDVKRELRWTRKTATEDLDFSRWFIFR